MTMLTSVLVDRKETDIRIEAAMSKMMGTEATCDIIYDTMQIIGGRGFETAHSLAARGDYPFPIERAMRDNRINTIFEGSSEIMRLFLAREAMDPHLKAAGEAVNSKLPMGRRLKAAMKAAGFYATWYPKQWLPLGGPSTAGLEPGLAKEVRYVARTSRKLARRMFHAMLRFGPRLEREQMLLGRFVGVGTELFAIAASCARAQHLINEGRDHAETLALVDHFCRESRLRVDEFFRGIRKNNDAVGYKLAQSILGDGASWMTEEVIGEAPLARTKDETPEDPQMVAF
jgi:alkylation response protein AidB-like acyl-CoA dehydrogenase